MLFWYFYFPQSNYTNESKIPIHIIIYGLVGIWFPYPKYLYIGLGKKNYVSIGMFKLCMVIMRRPFSSESNFNCQTTLKVGAPRRLYICKLNIRFLHQVLCVHTHRHTDTHIYIYMYIYIYIYIYIYMARFLISEIKKKNPIPLAGQWYLKAYVIRKIDNRGRDIRRFSLGVSS